MFRREPVHCVEGTIGVASQLTYRKGKNIKTFTRGYDENDYSVFKSAGLHDWLHNHGCRTIFLVGTDLAQAGYASAKDAKRLGYNVVVPMACNTSRDIRGDLDRGNTHLQSFITMGCKVI